MIAQLMFSLAKEERAKKMTFNQGSVEKIADSYVVKLTDAITYEFSN